MLNKISITFKALNKNISLARNVASAFLLDLDPMISYLNEVKTFISEAVTNAIVHGYSNDESKDLTMNLEISKDELIIQIIDSGVGISDINKAREPLFSTKKDEERSGLGFTIMEVFVDSLDVTSKVNVGTTIYATKKLPQNI